MWLSLALVAGMPDKYKIVQGADVILPAERERLLVPDVLAVRMTDIDVRDNYWRVETGRDGPIVHVFALVADDPENGGGPMYTRTHGVRPGQSATVDAPWPVTLTPPELGAPR
jgi:hypothetical protein